MSERSSDALAFAFPVQVPATLEAYAANGHLDKGAMAYTLIAPSAALPGVGGLEITTGTTALQALADGAAAIGGGYYTTSEIASRVLANVALKPALAGLSADAPASKRLADQVQSDILELRNRQRADGGFWLWGPTEKADWPYLGIHAAHAAQRARAAGFYVPSELLTRSRSYLRNILAAIPAWYPPRQVRSIEAYALYVRALIGDRDVEGVKRVLRQVRLEDLSLDAVGWLFGALIGDDAAAVERRSLRAFLFNRIAQTAGAAHFIASYDESDYLLFKSNRQADAIALEGMIRDSRDHPLIPKLMEGLMASERPYGRFDAARESPFVLLAAREYYEAYEHGTPNLTADVWLARQPIVVQQFQGANAQRRQIEIPLSSLGSDKADLVVHKEGAGRLYYRLGLRYAPASGIVAARDQGFRVRRTYEGIDDKSDVQHEPNGTWRVRAGARVRVTVTFVATGRRQHVALFDPMPAGLEPIDFRLAGNSPPPREIEPRYWQWWRSGGWSNYANLRDERAEAYAALLESGQYSYSYLALAATPGEFVAGPPRVEEMYHPETFGRGATDKVIVY